MVDLTQMTRIPAAATASGGRGTTFRAAARTGQPSPRRPKVLLLTSQLLTDRVFLYSTCIPALAHPADVCVWAASGGNPRYAHAWAGVAATVEPFPEVRPFKEFPYNFARRLNDLVWDARVQRVSRRSAARHRLAPAPVEMRLLGAAARILAPFKIEGAMEAKLERLLLGYPRSREASERLEHLRPDVLVTTAPYQFAEPAVVAAAKNLGIPVLALIPSWDNLTTKGRMPLKHDGYLVWSQQTREELHRYYSETREKPVYTVGAPQFDVFFDPRFQQTREEFCRLQGLQPGVPIILYGLGSPNFLRGEADGAADLAARVASGELGEVQMIVRPHPVFDAGELAARFRGFGSRVVLQRPVGDATTGGIRSLDDRQVCEWVNGFRHADVVVNMSSTITVDAAICDRPVVNLDYDPAPGAPQQQLIREINHSWDHFKPLAESGGLWLACDREELVQAIRAYLEDPALHRERRRWIAHYVCGQMDGCSGERMANAIVEFARARAETPA